MKISFVMANYNRRQLLINTLKTIEYYNLGRDIEIIVVDDNSSPEESVLDVPDLFKVPVTIVPVTGEEKSWTWDGIVFNIGFSMMNGDMVIIQNPENLHVGDIAGYAINNLKDNIFLSFALYSMDQRDTDNLIKKTIAKGIYSGEEIERAVGVFVGKKDKWADGETCWYNHSKYQVSGCHLISAIMRKDIEDLHGFDERYYNTFAYSDMELRERIKRKGMEIRIIDSPFAIHQRHDLSKYKENAEKFNRAGILYGAVTLQEKIYRAPQNFFYRPMIKSRDNIEDKITECPISGDTGGIEFLNLGSVPLVNNLCDTKQQSFDCKKYPLAVQIFPESRLVCLTEIINKESLFLNYVYRSGVNRPFLTHCSEMYDYLSCYIKLKKGDVVVDTGGNDGSLLIEFRKKNPDPVYINIDASKSFEEINKKAGIRYINKFFDENFELEEGIKAGLITSTNVFQHTWPIRSFVKGVYRNLQEDGIWCLEFPYLLTTLLNDNYDQVYHEHVFYFILSNIVDLSGQEGMRVFNVSFHDIHAGTLRVLSVKSSSFIKSDKTVSSFLNLEKSLTPGYCVEWGKRTQVKIDLFRKFIKGIKDGGKTIFGFGAAAKGCVFLNSVGIDCNTISFIIDDTPFKQNKFVPGTGIKIVGRDILRQSVPDYILILAHNFKDYIIESLKGEYNGKFIIMFPDIKIL